MRLRITVIALTFTALILTFAFIPAESEAFTIDPYEVYPGFLYLPLTDFDEKGDTLLLTITFKGTSSEDYVPRGIDILIVEEARATKTQRFDFLESEAIWVQKNVSIRIEEKIENPSGSKQAIVFSNPVRENDEDDWDNATVRIRIDYEVKNKEAEEGFDFIPVLVVILLVIIIVGAVVLTVFYFKRRSKDARSFFNPETGPYYAFRSVIDGKTYYIDPDQYARLYESNSLGNYDFLGTASRIGGNITPPEGQQLETAVPTAIDGQALTPVPIQDGGPGIDLASLEATPVAVDPAPADNLQETSTEPFNEGTGSDPGDYSNPFSTAETSGNEQDGIPVPEGTDPTVPPDPPVDDSSMQTH